MASSDDKMTQYAAQIGSYTTAPISSRLTALVDDLSSEPAVREPDADTACGGVVTAPIIWGVWTGEQFLVAACIDEDTANGIAERMRTEAGLRDIVVAPVPSQHIYTNAQDFPLVQWWTVGCEASTFESRTEAHEGLNRYTHRQVKYPLASEAPESFRARHAATTVRYARHESVIDAEGPDRNEAISAWIEHRAAEGDWR